MTDDHYQVTLGSSTRVRDDLRDVTDLTAVDWTFEGWNTQQHTHGLHPYPARMIPQIVRALLGYYENQGVISPGDLVYDPFSGSGTTSVEARLAGYDTKANDINPLAAFLTLAKARPLPVDRLEAFRRDLMGDLAVELRAVRERYAAGDGFEELEEPEVREGWFPQPQLYELCTIRDRIDELEATWDGEHAADLARFFRVALSRTTRETSYQRNGEYKRYLIPESNRGDHDPNVYELFDREVSANVDMMRSYAERVDHERSSEVYLADSRTAADVATDSVDIVITSPPYGDHSTTVAYGEFSQDPAIVAWERTYDEMRNVDKIGLGGSARKLEPLETLEEWSPSLEATLDVLREKDGRAEDALEFFTDYYAVMEQVARVLKPGHPIAWVVANRTMSRVNIPTHLITTELCERIGFDHQHTLAREIPNKKLPLENAPENTPGVTGELMANENIVVMTAPDD
ncbi:DNA methyltransferase [Natrinema salifodinae]|uniref:site-specific DNA-methyltransferase (cytosine-N(4)-specific) n=1 Tax=Natrinema salifodinae TaxID=1202768 RepID=A0A1I0NTD3_9EURY|nr:DNA methyltransferase [Natrinema salifodinae]SEW04161.1 DNA methylase [Natrinema salifodinae]